MFKISKNKSLLNKGYKNKLKIPEKIGYFILIIQKIYFIAFSNRSLTLLQLTTFQKFTT